MRVTLLLGVAAALLNPAPVSAQPEDTPDPPGLRTVPAHGANYAKRGSRTIERIVIHTIEGSEQSAINWFTNPRARSSAHYIVSHAGRVTRMVDDGDVAYHVRGANGTSIGIENEGYAGKNGWTEAQYEALADLVARLCARHGLSPTRSAIVGHSQLDPRRRTDPGAQFDWDRFLRLVRRYYKPLVPARSGRGRNARRGPRRRSSPPPVAGDDLLQRLVLAEAQGEGSLGMALVARAVMNRVALVQAGEVTPGTYLAKGKDLASIVRAKNQFEPVRNGALERPRSAAELEAAAEAIALGMDTDRLRADLEAEGLGDAEIERLLKATGFRTKSAFRDPSQGFERQPFGNHVFNSDRFSVELDVLTLFEQEFGHADCAAHDEEGVEDEPPTAGRRGMTGALGW